MNYIKQINAFWEMQQMDSLKGEEMIVYVALLNYANKRGWREKLRLPNRAFIGLGVVSNRQKLNRIRARLVELGYITYAPSKSIKECGVYTITKLYEEDGFLDNNICDSLDYEVEETASNAGVIAEPEIHSENAKMIDETELIDETEIEEIAAEYNAGECEIIGESSAAVAVDEAYSFEERDAYDETPVFEETPCCEDEDLSDWDKWEVIDFNSDNSVDRAKEVVASMTTTENRDTKTAKDGGASNTHTPDRGAVSPMLKNGDTKFRDTKTECVTSTSECATEHMLSIENSTVHTTQPMSAQVPRSASSPAHTSAVNSAHTPERSSVTSKNRDTKSKDTKSMPKRKYYDTVYLTDEEYSQLKSEYGDNADGIIEFLNNYKCSSGKSYRSDFHAIRAWAGERYMERKRPKKAYSSKAAADHAPMMYGFETGKTDSFFDSNDSSLYTLPSNYADIGRRMNEEMMARAAEYDR